MSNELKYLYDFGGFRFDIQKRVLWQGPETVALPPKALEVLACLIAEHGNLVERDELIRTVWPDTFVEEGNLNHAISVLRKVLGPDCPIQTVPRRGYRFAANVSEIINSDASASAYVIEYHSTSHTVIEENEEFSTTVSDASVKNGSARLLRPLHFGLAFVGLVIVLVLMGAPGFTSYIPGNGPKIFKAPNTIAILPLRPLDSEIDDSIAQGITQNLASRLGALEQLVVRPIGSTAQVAATEPDPILVGKKLTTDAVLEGSYESSMGRIRIMVRLLRVADGSQIWAGSFDEAETDIFKLQDSLAAQAANQLIPHLTSEQQRRLKDRYTDNVEAYRLYLRGRYEWNKRSKESVLESIRLFKDAIEADPTFSVAYAGLADSYVILNDYEGAPPNESFPKAKAAALKALQIEPGLVEPRVTLAYVLATYDWNYQEAETEYRHAIDLSPNYATAHQWYGEMLCALSRFSEANIELRRAAELDPLVPIIQSEIGVVLYYSGKYDEAIEHFARLENEFPRFRTSYQFSAWGYEQMGLPDKSFEQELMYWRLQNADQKTLGDMERAYRNGGRVAFLNLLAGIMEEKAKEVYFREYRLVHIYARLRNTPKLLEWLEQGINTRSASIVKVHIDPNFDYLRDDERFKALLSKLGLPSR